MTKKNMTEQEWLQYGIDHEFVWGYCIQHEDGMTSNEVDDRENGDDYCITGFRIRSEYLEKMRDRSR